MAQPRLPDITEWPEITVDWWETWGRDERTRACTDADWLFMLDGALLHATVWGSGDVARLSDLRAHVKAFEARLAELAKSAPVQRKGTALDELAKRRANRKAAASG